MKGKFVYANGFNISQARKLFKYVFRDFFLRAERNERELQFDVFLRDKFTDENGKEHSLKKEKIDDFEEYWNVEANIFGSNGIFNLIVLTNKETVEDEN